MRDRRKDKFPCTDCGAPRERRAASGLCKPCSSRRSLYPTTDADGKRECIDCKERKPFAQFGINQKVGKSYVKHQCKDCYNRSRRAGRVYSGERPYTCPTCKDTKVWTRTSQCRPCFRESQRRQMESRNGAANERETYMPPKPPSEARLQAAKHDADQLRTKALVRHTAEPERYMEIAYGEIWTLTAKCKGCGKYILIPGRCYECAVNSPRKFLRAEEREREATANVV